MSETIDLTRIRELNDTFRRTMRGGTLVMTAGVLAFSSEQQMEVLKAVGGFESFDADNDPHHEHDFGAVEVAGARLFWKIDYYDRSLTRHSEDATDPLVTRRVLTIMLAEEY